MGSAFTDLKIKDYGGEAARPEDFIASLNAQTFVPRALEEARLQYADNPVYRQWCNALGRTPVAASRLEDIPFLPVSLFKTHAVRTGADWQPEAIFRSSRTTGDAPSQHAVRSLALYDAALLRGYEHVYGLLKGTAILALLPSYLERADASLVHMARVLMAESDCSENGFFLHDFDALAHALRQLEAAGRPTLLLGVTFALLDFAEAYPMPLQHTTVMETGGMKGRREEWTRARVHSALGAAFGLPCIHSEYGATELLSQAYAHCDGLFRPAPTMRVLVRDAEDPLAVSATGTGALCVVDLANIHSCAALATEDLGRVYPDGSFEVLGRMDHSALRGCSLMAA